MGVSRQQAEANRQAIVDAAARLFRQRGVDGVGLAELMRTAGFTTQGGFYNHFRSKDDLVAQVVAHEMRQAPEQLAEQLRQPLSPGDDPVVRQVDNYLSEAHRDDVEAGCAVAGFAGEVARLAPAAQALYAEGLDATLEQLRDLLARPESGGAGAARGRAIRLYSQMVGALLLSRAVHGADRRLAQEILSETRDHLAAAFAAPRSPAPSRRGRRTGAPSGSDAR